MNIEIVEFFPIEIDQGTGYLSGTLRICLSDIGIHILGIHVTKRKNSWFFSLPGRVANDHRNGKPIRYPFICFEDRETQKQLIDAIREKGRVFIEKRLSENPLNSHQKVKEDEVNPLSPEEKNNPAQTELKPIPNTQKRVWVTPPPLKRRPTASYRRK
jgi:hypothetical protein